MAQILSPIPKVCFCESWIPACLARAAHFLFLVYLGSSASALHSEAGNAVNGKKYMSVCEVQKRKEKKRKAPALTKMLFTVWGESCGRWEGRGRGRERGRERETENEGETETERREKDLE